MGLKKLLLVLPTVGLVAGLVYGCGGASPARPVTMAAHMGEDPRAPARETETCPDTMVLVEGEYCPEVVQRCKWWMDPPGKYHEYRCGEYAQPAKCNAKREHRRFCIDRYERTEDGSDMPKNVQSWIDTRSYCEAQGARVCMESEWQFACEGEEMRPYPYGWKRDASLCNADQMDLLEPDDPSKIRDLRAPAHAHPKCSSPFGVVGMAGNVAEWVSVDGVEAGTEVVQKGAWWHPGKQACRAAQAGHDKFYKGTETGFRCCKDAAPGAD
jgi:hypothetical protein